MKLKKKNIFKMIIITISTFMFISIISPTISSASSTESEDAFNKISDEEFNETMDMLSSHSYFDKEKGMYILNYSIVKEGLITEKQFNDVKYLENKLYNENSEKSPSKQRLVPLVAAAIAVITAAAIFIGVTLAANMITYVTNWGVYSFCKKYKKKHKSFKSFCTANGF